VTGDTEQAAFVVRQPGFEGSLGELAYALRRGAVAPSEIDLLSLVQSYLEHFNALAGIDLELASVALPNVAQVIELKLRLLLPRPPSLADPSLDYEGEEELLEETLEAVAMLEELEDAIDFLRQRRDERRIVLPARTPRLEFPRPARPIGTGIDQLASLASRYRGGGYFELAVDRLTMGAAIKQLLEGLRRWGRIMLHEATLRDESAKPEWSRLTVLFAGMLELVREGRITASQEAPYGEIELQLAEVEAVEVA
jgi:segregation and condensation protein A